MKKVLVVDDMTFMRIALRTLLEKNEYEVVGEAADGEEAVKKYAQCKPDIVTMDVTMPKMSGIEALKGILRHDSQAKIVMVSAMGQTGFVKEAIMGGAKYFIVKPYKEDKVLEVMQKVSAM